MTESLISRERAWALVTEHVQSESLRKHLLGVEAAVRGYARQFGEDEEAWGFVALVHDMEDFIHEAIKADEGVQSAGFGAVGLQLVRARGAQFRSVAHWLSFRKRFG